MKNLFYLIIAFFSLTFSLQSCEDDGDWADASGGQFGFTVERDDFFIEKSVGESNQLKFNVVTNYDFSSVPMKIKYTSSLNATLSLGSVNLQPNTEYPLNSKDNILSYVGNVAGTHDLKIIVTNDKGASKEEKFSLKYGVSEFTHTYTGGTADIYQSDETNYLMKIEPSAGQPLSGYEIKFNDYNTNNGTIKLNGVTAQSGQFYPLPNINSFNVVLATNKIGQGALNYTIKNATVTKDYNIQQTIIARQIVVESMNVNSLNVIPNTQMSLIGVVKKSPITTNTSVSYKTWISSASNNNMSGIQNTNNVYLPYSLTSTGSFSYTFNAIQAGTYSYNVQFKDEFGNESTVKSFNIEVQSPLQFVGTPTGSLTLARQFFPQGNGAEYRVHWKEYMKNFKVVAGGGNSITQIKYEYKFTFAQTPLVTNFEENFTGGNSTVEQTNVVVPINTLYSTNTFSFGQTSVPITDGTLKITAFASNGTSINQTVSIPVNFVNY